jgi:hypothetical protein
MASRELHYDGCPRNAFFTGRNALFTGRNAFFTGRSDMATYHIRM